jgi:hypothetical protein
MTIEEIKGTGISLSILGSMLIFAWCVFGIVHEWQKHWHDK